MEPLVSPHPACLDPEALLAQCDREHFRTRGPGGQHRNKVDSAVELRHRPTGLAGEATERRSQEENHRVALFRLRVNLALQVRTTPTPGAPPSDLWRSRCRGGRLFINPGHQDFPAMLAEALDHLAAVNADPKRAALWLGCTMSQLVRFIKDEPRAILWLNEQRQRRGLRPMH